MTGNPKNTNIVFVQNAVPALEDDSYTITVSQEVIVNGTTEVTYTTSQDFAVVGKRFSLAPTDITSAFPPPTHQGAFDNVLPHVLITTPSLAWQRSPIPDDNDQTTSGNNTPPWMALFMFDEADTGAPQSQSVTVADLISVSPGTLPSGTFFPQNDLDPANLDPGMALTDIVNIIDVPIALFNSYAPSLNDLGWLGHVRQVEVVAKPTKNGQPSPGEYGVITGNRLPQDGLVTTMYLVSLENYSTYLPGDDGTPSTAFPSGTNYVRLAVLYSWSFTSNLQQESFTGLLEALDSGPLQIPVNTSASSGNATADQEVENILNMGYSGLPHTLRNGQQTVSWYRGPLLPFGTTEFLTARWNDPDQLLRYDPTAGMFDTTYAAAWQIGRLMALQNQAYVTSLFRWKHKHLQNTWLNFEQEILDETINLGNLGGNKITSAAERNNERLENVFTNVVRPAVDALNKKNTDNA